MALNRVAVINESIKVLKVSEGTTGTGRLGMAYAAQKAKGNSLVS